MLCADAFVNIFFVFVHLVAVAVIENFQKVEGFQKRDIVVVCKIQKTASEKQSAFDFSAVRRGDSAKISEIKYVVHKILRIQVYQTTGGKSITIVFFYDVYEVARGITSFAVDTPHINHAVG